MYILLYGDKEILNSEGKKQMYNHLNKYTDIKFNVHDTFLESPSSGMLIYGLL